MKEIPLTQGKFTIVDDEDYGELMRYKWYAKKQAINSDFYAARNSRTSEGLGRTIFMHSQILGNNGRALVIDHADNNTLNNQRSNLRLCTQKNNAKNQKKRSDNKSGYKGVLLRKYGAYLAHIRKDGIRMGLGTFKSAVDAAVAYDIAAEKYYGEFAKLNFPRQNSEMTYLCGYEIRTDCNTRVIGNITDSAKGGIKCYNCQWAGGFERLRF